MVASSAVERQDAIHWSSHSRNRLTWCFCGEPEHILILVEVSSCLWFLREELRSAGVSITLSLMQVTNLAWTFSLRSGQVIFNDFFCRIGALVMSDYVVTNVITRTSPIEISHGQRQCACCSCRSFGRAAYNELTRQSISVESLRDVRTTAISSRRSNLYVATCIVNFVTGCGFLSAAIDGCRSCHVAATTVDVSRTFVVNMG